MSDKREARWARFIVDQQEIAKAGFTHQPVVVCRSALINVSRVLYVVETKRADDVVGTKIVLDTRGNPALVTTDDVEAVGMRLRYADESVDGQRYGQRRMWRMQLITRRKAMYQNNGGANLDALLEVIDAMISDRHEDAWG